MGPGSHLSLSLFFSPHASDSRTYVKESRSIFDERGSGSAAGGGVY